MADPTPPAFVATDARRNPPFSSIELPDLVAVVEAQLMQAIVSGHIAPGARIVEAELARQMGVSRAPVREAARRLESQGLLVSRPRHGFTVRTMSVKEIDDLYEVRLGQEVMAATLACRHASDAQLARLLSMVDEMSNMVDRMQQSERTALDLAFHSYICEISGNAYLHRLFGNIQAEVRMILALTDGSFGAPKYIAESHRPIAEAIVARDAAAAESALRVHLKDGNDHVRALFLASEKRGDV